jgi:hypothetical protein
MPQAGDLQGESEPIVTDRAGIDLVIDRIRP